MSVEISNRLEKDEKLRRILLPHCRLKPGDIWCDPAGRHLIGCGDAADSGFVKKIHSKAPPATLAIQDPPYNLIFGKKLPVSEFIEWCQKWILICHSVLAKSSALYIWLGADQNNHFQPLPQFMSMMSTTDFTSRSFITMRNQRGYGTQQNWMAARQELLYYTMGKPKFKVSYTDIPKVLKGYYKEIAGLRTENIERSKSPNIRAGNVWIDIQQVFYRMEENVNGCYAQKPLKSIERIVESSSSAGETVTDFFAHSGTTLVACEKLGRRCVTFDLDPIFAEICIRRLERFRATGKTGWQLGHPFEKELQRKMPDSLSNQIAAVK